MSATAKCTNPNCTEIVQRLSKGRVKRFCSDRCRQQTYRNRLSRYEMPGGTTDTGVAFSEQNCSTISTACKGENGDLQKAQLRWIEVNSVTHKLTDGVMERTPLSHGQWGGFNIERGVAWVIEVGKPFGKVAWYARCGDSSYGPTDFNRAKQAAMVLAKGAKSFPQSGIASSFTGPINLHADPEVAAEMRKADGEWRDWPPDDDAP